MGEDKWSRRISLGFSRSCWVNGRFSQRTPYSRLHVHSSIHYLHEGLYSNTFCYGKTSDKANADQSVTIAHCPNSVERGDVVRVERDEGWVHGREEVTERLWHNQLAILFMLIVCILQTYSFRMVYIHNSRSICLSQNNVLAINGRMQILPEQVYSTYRWGECTLPSSTSEWSPVGIGIQETEAPPQ